MTELQAGEIKKPQKQVKKTGFLQKAVRTGLAAAALGTIALTDTPKLGGRGTDNIIAPTSQERLLRPQSDVMANFINRMELKYGIVVKPDFVFWDFDDPTTAEFFVASSKPSSPLTVEEIPVLEEAIRSIPYCAEITDKLYTFKEPRRKDDSPLVFGRVYRASKDGGSTGIQLNLAVNIDLSSTPPEEYTKLGLKTYREVIKHTFFHECGHRVSDRILRAAYSDDEYFDIINPERIEMDYLREKKNPIFKAFSKLENWVLRKEIFEQTIPQEHVYVRDMSDERVYGRASVRIEEHFAELFAIFHANPLILTPQERMFFQKIDEGFRENVGQFANKLAQDPMMLLAE